MAPTRSNRGARWAPRLLPKHKASRHDSEAFGRSVFGKKSKSETASVAFTSKEIRPPPGLEEFYGAAWEEETYVPIPPEAMVGADEMMMAGDDDILRKTVRLSCLPNEVTSDELIQVALEQAGFNKGVVGVSTEQGMCFGQATIICATTDEAAQLVEHFNGRRWDSSGVMVAAQLLSDEVENFHMMTTYAAGFDWQCGWDDQSMQMLGAENISQDETMPHPFSGMSAEAVEFVPVTMSADAVEFTPGNMSAEAQDFVPMSMSADVAEFVPSTMSATAQEFVPGKMSAAAPEFVPGKALLNTCDSEVAAETDSAASGSASENGDSASVSSGDEKVGAIVA